VQKKESPELLRAFREKQLRQPVISSGGARSAFAGLAGLRIGQARVPKRPPGLVERELRLEGFNLSRPVLGGGQFQRLPDRFLGLWKPARFSTSCRQRREDIGSFLVELRPSSRRIVNLDGPQQRQAAHRFDLCASDRRYTGRLLAGDSQRLSQLR